VYSTPHGFNAVAFADMEYPSRVAFGYLAQLGDEFLKANGNALVLPPRLDDGCMHAGFKVVHDAMLLKFQNPAEADQLTSIMKQLDETKLVLVRAGARTCLARSRARTGENPGLRRAVH
jgi:hypothetical protein